jgi:hypothetical protein
LPFLPADLRPGQLGAQGRDLGDGDRDVGAANRREPLRTMFDDMSSQGSPYTIFRRAWSADSLVGVRSAVANLPGPAPLEDALAICRLLLEQEPDCYERAAVRWLGRLLLEQPGVSLRHAELAAG